MENTFNLLPDELLYQCLYPAYSPEQLSVVDKRFKSITQEIFYQLNTKILRAYSDWKERNLKEESSQTSSQHLFMRLIKHIMDDAEHLQFKIEKYIYSDKNPSRLNWGVEYISSHFQEIDELNQKIHKERKRSFNFLKSLYLSNRSANDNAFCEMWSNAKLKGYFMDILDLNVPKQKLYYLPPQVSDLVNLKTFSYPRNFLNSLPIELKTLTKVEDVILNGNKFEYFPEIICFLPNLKSLDLSHNSLSQLPPNLTQLTRLDRLALAGNQFTEIPEVAFSLTRLQTLYVPYNQISVIPNKISPALKFGFRSNFIYHPSN